MSEKASPARVQFDRRGPHLTVRITGEVDYSVSREVGDQVLAELRPGDERLWLDLGSVTFCDSSGIGMMMRLREVADRRGMHFSVSERTGRPHSERVLR